MSVQRRSYNIHASIFPTKDQISFFSMSSRVKKNRARMKISKSSTSRHIVEPCGAETEISAVQYLQTIFIIFNLLSRVTKFFSLYFTFLLCSQGTTISFSWINRGLPTITKIVRYRRQSHTRFYDSTTPANRHEIEWECVRVEQLFSDEYEQREEINEVKVGRKIIPIRKTRKIIRYTWIKR